MKVNKVIVQEMDEYTLKRWLALIEGVHMINEEAEKRGISPEKVDFKQHHLVQFIDHRTERIKLI